jgi:HTH-type transcriptional regulator / antitoxin HipB
MIETAQDFGDLVRKARRAQGLTQRELALVANVGERFIVDLEAGKATCQLGKALMIAATLKLGLDVDQRALEPRQSGPEIPEFSEGFTVSASRLVWGS